jgi:hypothetical protein
MQHQIQLGGAVTDLEIFKGLENRERIGVEELAAAIVLPRHDSWVDWTFWRNYVELARNQLGLTAIQRGEARWLDRCISELKLELAPMCRGMEVPRVVGEAFRSLDDYSELRDRVRSLQWRFFMALIIAIDPSMRHRTTTLSNLRELGLTGPRAIDYDDF